ncbi:hypothetical protein [Acidianus sp. HS-5]|uniref:hypothetical protein n=1 Tax=Acidianus sp. HS-5 TaxID=2886040 RepID=UPI001F215E84|nr:hypothetical protein [Acidianus sp. HS-5]BDC17437.1 hypothetical protein HS5_03270 [Acidianus sp. HS-5]
MKEYLLVDDIKDLADAKKLASLILWLKRIELKVVDVSLFEEPRFIDDCDWEEWSRIAKRVKEELINEGMEDIAKQ